MSDHEVRPETQQPVAAPISESKTSDWKQSQTMTQQVEASLRLKLVPGVGPKTFGDLIKHFGSPSEVLAAAPAEIRRVPGIGAKIVSAIVAAPDDTSVQKQVELCNEHGIDILTTGSRDYPAILDEIYDPPSVLFCAGELKPVDEIAVAIVGARHATQYGKKVAKQLARGLALAGVTVVSGLARGIDGVAHRAALEAGGRTIAVLGGGILNVYPAEHAGLADQIKENGAVLSEALPRVAPKSGCFPRRNRIISGLSLGVVVVEAGSRSGAAISARLAMEQGVTYSRCPEESIAACPLAVTSYSKTAPSSCRASTIF